MYLIIILTVQKETKALPTPPPQRHGVRYKQQQHQYYPRHCHHYFHNIIMINNILTREIFGGHFQGPNDTTIANITFISASPDFNNSGFSIASIFSNSFNFLCLFFKKIYCAFTLSVKVIVNTMLIYLLNNVKSFSRHFLSTVQQFFKSFWKAILAVIRKNSYII